MIDPSENSTSAAALPAAKIKHKIRGLPLVWVVPVVAAIVAGYVVYDRVREFGPRITVTFNDGSGVVPGQTPIRYRGVPIGEVTAVQLSKDLKHAEIIARLQRSAAPIAREGAIFWIVRPEVGIGNITGLQTVLTGPEIQVLPGTGEPKSQFIGLETAPPGLERKGLNIVLRAVRPGFLRRNSPVYYRGVEVGAVRKIELSPNATSVDIHVFIKQRYANLVRNGSMFWNVRGFDMNAGLFRGLEIKVESLRSLIAGGVAFATPNDPRAALVKDGAVFPLYHEPRKEWLGWAPRISIPPAE